MMKDTIISLSQKNRNNNFLKNKLELRCDCGFTEKLSYYSFLSAGEFIIGQPTAVISHFISESVYDETINVTPLYISKKCPSCGKEIVTVFPISLENLIPMLQLQPPDTQMYG